MHHDTMLEGSSFLRGQDVALQSPQKDEQFLGAPLLRYEQPIEGPPLTTGKILRY